MTEPTFVLDARADLRAALATPAPLDGLTVGDLIDALHDSRIGCDEMAHWDTGQGDPNDHLQDANALLASLLAARLRENTEAGVTPPTRIGEGGDK